LGVDNDTTKHAQHYLMAFLRAFSASKTGTATTVAKAFEPTVTAVHVKEDGLPESLKTAQCYSSTPSKHSLDEKNPFSDPKVAEFYKRVYERCQYECRAAFDPELEWTPAEERRIVRKLDFRVCAFACFAFFALQVDRGNMAQAVSDNLLSDLNLTTNDYNTGMMGVSSLHMVLYLTLIGNTIFKVSFLLAEIPSQLISKKLGPDRWIPSKSFLGPESWPEQPLT
jgi:hypothetical protein